MSRLQDMANLYKGVRIYIFRGFLNIYIYIYVLKAFRLCTLFWCPPGQCVAFNPRECVALHGQRISRTHLQLLDHLSARWSDLKNRRGTGVNVGCDNVRGARYTI